MTASKNKPGGFGETALTDKGRHARRWNPWPVSIVAFFCVAIAGAAVFIVFCNLHKTDLVSADYYEQELRYQSQMERAQRGQALGDEAVVGYDAASKRITLEIPTAQAESNPSGTIHLYRPSSAGMDQRINLQLNALGHQVIDAAALSPGLWKVKVLWTAGGQDYYIDRKLVIPARS